MKRLLAFGSFAHDPQRILAAIQGLAVVSAKFVPELIFRLFQGASVFRCGLKLGSTSATDSHERQASGFTGDYQHLLGRGFGSLLRHADSFPQVALGCQLCGFQTAPVPLCPDAC
jgi:hypothetical protein